MTDTPAAPAKDERVALSSEFFNHLFQKLDAVLVEEDHLHPYGCAAWLEIANCAVDEAKFAVTNLRAHVAALTAQLEAERATGDETARHVSRLLDHLARETARADAAEKDAKALREGLNAEIEECAKICDEAARIALQAPNLDFTTHADFAGGLAMDIADLIRARKTPRATLAQPVDGGK